MPDLPAENRRLYRRYPLGLPARLVLDAEALPVRVVDISLGGAALELGGLLPDTTPGRPVALRAPALAGGYAFPAAIRGGQGPRLNIAFELDAEAEFELTMALMADPVTMG